MSVDVNYPWKIEKPLSDIIKSRNYWKVRTEAAEAEVKRLRDAWDKILSAYMKCDGDPQPVMDAVGECRSLMLKGGE